MKIRDNYNLRGVRTRTYFKSTKDEDKDVQQKRVYYKEHDNDTLF